MTRTIIIGFDQSARGEDALTLGADLARLTGVKALPFGIALPTAQIPMSEPSRADVIRLANERDVKEQLIGRGRIHVAPSPARGLSEVAEAEHADLLVIGSSHRGPLRRVLAGTTAQRLLHGSPCPVAVAPAGYAKTPVHPFKRIGVGFDGSPEARLAAEYASALAKPAGAEVVLIAVEFSRVPGGVLTYSAALARDVIDSDFDLERELQHAIEGLRAGGVATVARQFERDPGPCLVEESKQLDLLVMGSRGYGPRSAVLLGSVSGHVVHRAYCPVVVVPRGADEHTVPVKAHQFQSLVYG
jgi:nucleotide-binding universal stress UspA family protein